jgi:hypothetical protein
MRRSFPKSEPRGNAALPNLRALKWVIIPDSSVSQLLSPSRKRRTLFEPSHG